MKKLWIAAVAGLLMTSCAADYQDYPNDTQSDTQTTLTSPQVQPAAKLESLDSYNQIPNNKIGYGQGKQLDSKNRPAGAEDFNSAYEKYNAKAINSDKEKTITLTFDQGYENGCTAKILDTLKEKDVKAVFFVIQDYAEKNPELISRMLDEGHTLGNHSEKHRSMPGLSVQDCVSEVMNLHTYILENYNYEMNLFRPPCGEFSERSLAITKDCGYTTVLWSYAYRDWEVDNQPVPAEALKNLISAAHSGAIYLLHSVSSTNMEILPDFIDEMKKQGYTFTV